MIKNFNSQQFPEEILIKISKSVSLSNSASYLVFIIVSVFFLNLLLKNKTDNIIATAIMPVGAIIFSLIMLFLEIRKINSVVIRVNKKGIQICKRPLMNWNDIENEKIISRTFSSKESRHDFKSTVNYLHFYFKNEIIEIEIDNLKVTDLELRNYLTIYREKFNEEKANYFGH